MFDSRDVGVCRSSLATWFLGTLTAPLVSSLLDVNRICQRQRTVESVNDDTLVLIDTNILNFLLHAMQYGDFPRTQDVDVRAQQVATFRLYLWRGLGSVGRILVNEISKHPHEGKREWLERIAFYQLNAVWVQDEDIERWKARAAERGTIDCQLVAEAEIVGASTILTFDKKMVRNLRPHTTIDLMTPDEYWTSLAIPRGTPPKWSPAASNPLATATFWRWE